MTDKLVELENLKAEIEALPQTGSRAYGIVPVGSDTDDDRYCCGTEQFDKLKERLATLGVETKPGGSVTGHDRYVYFTLGGIRFNLFALTQRQADAFAAATVAVRAIHDLDPKYSKAGSISAKVATGKRYRILLFRSICNALMYGGAE